MFILWSHPTTLNTTDPESTVDILLYAQVINSEGVAITDRVLVVEESSLSPSYINYSAPFTILGNPTKSEWESSNLRLEYVGSSGAFVRITNTSLVGTYSDAIVPFTANGSVLFNGTPSILSSASHTVAPVGSKNMLYVRDPAGVTAGDSAFISLFQSDDWNVTQWLSTSVIPVDMSSYDAVFISEEVISSDINTKYNSVTQGVVCAENGAWDDMLLAAGQSIISARTTWDINNPTHPLAAGYSGEVAVVSSAAQMRASSSDTIAYGAIQVANLPGGSTSQDLVWAYEAGQTLSNGSTTAAGRRVAMGLHGDTMTLLTTAGEDLVLAAVNWAAGTGTTPPPPSTTLLGVGSTSTSLVDYPKIADTTVGNKYVDASVTSSGDGNTLGNAYKTIQEGLSAISSGQTLIVKGGTYSVGTGLWRNSAWGSTTRIMAYGSDTVTLDGSNVSYDGSIITFSGSVNELWHGFYARNHNAGGNNRGQAIAFVDGAHDCTLSRFWVSHCLKDGIWGYGSYNIEMRDCAVWRLGSGSGGDTNAPDCYAMTGNANSGLQGIKYIRCFAGNGPDDGFDFYRNQGAICVDCVAYGSGYFWNGNASGGDGNAFKMGSIETNTHSNSVIGSIAIGSRINGLDDNGTDANNTFLRSTAVNCGSTGFQVGSGTAATVRDNIAFGNGLNYKEWASIADTNNNWNSPWTIGSPGNPSFADTANFDWSLGSGSVLIGIGVSGGNLGASDIALEIAKEWLAKDLS